MNQGRLLRAAVIGTGFVGPHHVDAIRRGGYAEVIALVGSDPARTEARARARGVARATTDVTALLGDGDIDVVHVCTPNSSHVELATAALEAGKHVVVEKPLALTTAEAEDLVGLARRCRRHAGVAVTYRGYPMVRRARDLVASGDIGEVRLVHGRYLQDWLLEASDYNWRLESGRGGPSRAVADIGSHWFDTAEFVSGRRVEAVMADLATFLPMRWRPQASGASFEGAGDEGQPVEVASEDAATLLVRFSDGARGSCVVSQVSPGHKNDFSLELAGSRRSLAWVQEDPNHLWLGTRGEAGSLLLPREPDGAVIPGVPALPPGHPEGWAEALRDLFRPFYAAIAAGAPPPEPEEAIAYPTFADGARAVAFVEAVLTSARECRWVELRTAAG
ncbi:Gfo/Idh/MocA family oxidoreductase [soil metagenome]